jgi:hypothetical protein
VPVEVILNIWVSCFRHGSSCAWWAGPSPVIVTVFCACAKDPHRCKWYYCHLIVNLHVEERTFLGSGGTHGGDDPWHACSAQTSMHYHPCRRETGPLPLNTCNQKQSASALKARIIDTKYPVCVYLKNSRTIHRGYLQF